jgi:hypothetical protein
MKVSAWSLGVRLLVLLMLSACGQAQQTGTLAGSDSVQPDTTPTNSGQAGASHGGPVKDHVSFVDHLRAAGFTVDATGSVQQPFLRPQGTILRISGGDLEQPADVQSYDYNDTDFEGNGAAAAEADASGIGPDGNPRTAMIGWIEPPHFFRKERALVLYIGSDAAVLKALHDVLGPQFAGG